jgi:superfamily II DNA/RNA helicase
LVLAEEKSGKTVGLAIGVIQRLQEEVGDVPRAIVVVQNKEHGEEVEEIFNKLVKYTSLRVYRPYKGGDIKKQRDVIYAGMDIVIGTAKRLNEIYLANGLNSRDLLVYAIDNAENVVKPEVVIQLDKLTDRMPKCQHVLFSTKNTHGIERYAERYLDSLKVVKLA